MFDQIKWRRFCRERLPVCVLFALGVGWLGLRSEGQKKELITRSTVNARVGKAWVVVHADSDGANQVGTVYLGGRAVSWRAFGPVEKHSSHDGILHVDVPGQYGRGNVFKPGAANCRIVVDANGPAKMIAYEVIALNGKTLQSTHGPQKIERGTIEVR